jgi:hypothetical protein
MPLALEMAAAWQWARETRQTDWLAAAALKQVDEIL